MLSEVTELVREAGGLPEGWSSISVAEALAKRRGGTITKLQTPDYLEVGALPIVDQGAKFVCGYTDQLDAAYPYDLPVIVFGDHTRTLKYIDFPFAVGADGTQCLHPTDAFDSRFFFYALENLDLRSEGYARHFKLLKEQAIAQPPLDEQQRIAEVLRSVDEAIVCCKDTAEQASRAIEGLLQRLFIDGLGHTSFKDGHSTTIPKSWSEQPLGALTSFPITYGVVQPGDSITNGVPLVRGGDFPNGRINLKSLRTISHEVASQYRRTRLNGGEVLVSLVGYPGACAVVPKELAGANVNRAVAVIQAGEKVTAEYLYHFIRSPVAQARLMKETIGSAQQVINLRDLKEVIVAVPPLDEQEKITAILADLDAFVELETANLDKLSALKRSIASDLLSGRVRVSA